MAALARTQSSAKMFEEFDTDGSGTIDAAELQQLAYSCGEVLSKAQTQALLEQLDTGKTGSVSREEFQAWIEKGAPTESEDRSMAQSLKLKYKLLSRHYGRKFGGDAAAAHDAAHNTYKVATSIGDPQKVKMRATLQVQPQTPEIKAALGAAPARASLSFTTKPGTTPEQAAALAGVFETVWQVGSKLAALDGEVDLNEMAVFTADIKPGGSNDVVVTLQAKSGSMPETADEMPMDLNTILSSATLAFGAGVDFDDLIASTEGTGPLANKTMLDVVRMATTSSIGAVVNRDFLKMGWDMCKQALGALYGDWGTVALTEEHIMEPLPTLPMPVNPLPIFAGMLGVKSVDMSFEFTDFEEFAELVGLMQGGDIPDEVKGMKFPVAKAMAKFLKQVLKVGKKSMEKLHDMESEDLLEFDIQKERALEMNTILLKTLHGLRDFIAASQVGPTAIIAFENWNCFSAFLPSPIPEGNPGADDSDLWEECCQDQGTYAWAKAFATLEEQFEAKAFNLPESDLRPPTEPS